MNIMTKNQHGDSVHGNEATDYNEVINKYGTLITNNSKSTNWSEVLITQQRTGVRYIS